VAQQGAGHRVYDHIRICEVEFTREPRAELGRWGNVGFAANRKLGGVPQALMHAGGDSATHSAQREWLHRGQGRDDARGTRIRGWRRMATAYDWTSRTAVASCAFNVFARDPASGTSANDARKLDAEFGSELTSYRAYWAPALTSRRWICRCVALPRGRVGNWGTFRMVLQFWRQLTSCRASGGILVTNGDRVLVGLCNYSHQRTAFDYRPFIVEPKRQRAAFRRFHDVQHFFGFDLIKRLARADAIAGPR